MFNWLRFTSWLKRTPLFLLIFNWLPFLSNSILTWSLLKRSRFFFIRISLDPHLNYLFFLLWSFFFAWSSLRLLLLQHLILTWCSLKWTLLSHLILTRSTLKRILLYHLILSWFSRKLSLCFPFILIKTIHSFSSDSYWNNNFFFAFANYLWV